jgi:hypothetical protein
MNQYQNFAALLIRFVGVVMAALGITEVVHDIILLINTTLTEEEAIRYSYLYSYSRWLEESIVPGAGIILVVFSKRFGRLLARGIV